MEGIRERYERSLSQRADGSEESRDSSNGYGKGNDGRKISPVVRQ